MKRTFAALVVGIWLASGALVTAGAESLQTVAKRLSKGLEPLKPKRIAVLHFPYHNGDVSSGSSIVSERLITLIVERGDTEVVERALLDKTLGEIRLGMSGMLDPSTTQKLGKVLGVKAIVTGTLIDLEEQKTEVNARLIDTETGSILAASTARIRRTWTDLPRRPVVVRTSDDEGRSTLHASKPIPTPSRGQAMLPMYATPVAPASAAAVEPSAEDDVLTLKNEDITPMRQRGMDDPARVLNDFLADSRPPPPNAVRMARRIYHRNPDPHVRARALIAMGHLLERSGRPDQAKQAYAQVLREFPNSSPVESEARQRLNHIASSR